MLAEDVGRRLENFFWRIWGSKRLLEKITGSLVAAIFSIISEGGYIRTTPTQSPRSSRSLGTLDRPQQAKGLNPSPPPGLRPTPARPHDVQKDDDAGDAEETETESPSSTRKKLPPRPPPILKKSKPASLPDTGQNQGSTGQPKPLTTNDTYTQRTPSGDHDALESELQSAPSGRSFKATRFEKDQISPGTGSRTRKVSEDVSEEPNDTDSMSRQKPSRRRVAVVANTGASKRRPAMRSRSSQSSSSSASMTSSSLPKSEFIVGGQAQEGSSAASTRTAEKSSKSPITSRQSLDRDKGNFSEEHIQEEPSGGRGQNVHRTADTGKQPKAGTRALPSHTSFTSILKRPTAAAAAAASYQASGTMDFGQQLPRNNDTGSEGKSRLPPSPGHAVPPPGSSDTMQSMPRTKSQLTLLLQRDRKAGNDQ